VSAQNTVQQSSATDTPNQFLIHAQRKGAYDVEQAAAAEKAKKAAEAKAAKAKADKKKSEA